MLNLTTINDPYSVAPTSTLQDIYLRSAMQGRSSSGMFTHKSIFSSLNSQDFPPDSKYWHGQAQASFDYIAKLLSDQYPQWAERTFPADSFSRISWHTIRDMIEAAIDLYQTGDANIEHLAAASHSKLAELLTSFGGNND